MICRTINRNYLHPHGLQQTAHYIPLTSKKIHNGIEIIARIEGISNKAAIDMLLGSGISRYLGELLQKHIENERLIREGAEGAEQIAMLKGIREIRKYLAEHGVSIYRSKKAGL